MKPSYPCLGFLFLASSALGFPTNPLTLRSGDPECALTIQIHSIADGYELFHGARKAAHFAPLDGKKRCHLAAPTGGIFRRKICVRSWYEASPGQEKLTQGLCDSDLPILSCSTDDHLTEIVFDDRTGSVLIKKSDMDAMGERDETRCEY